MIDLDLALIRYQHPDFKARLKRSIGIVQDALRAHRRPIIAFSGGKDSVAVAALVHLCRDTVPLLWSDDELEYPETVEMMTGLKRLAGDQLIVTLGYATHAGWFVPWADRRGLAPPGDHWREPLDGALAIDCKVETWQERQGYDLTFLGLRADENAHRRRLLIGQPYYWSRSRRNRRVCPIADWSADDVWALIAGWRLAYNHAYDTLERIGAPRERQRIGPLPLTPGRYLAEGWPEMFADLAARYPGRWEGEPEPDNGPW